MQKYSGLTGEQGSGFASPSERGMGGNGESSSRSFPPSIRYIRQIVLSEIGVSGQKKLAESKVLIVGVGGLGSPAALYLASAGIGNIGLVDDDVVNIDNLNRQILHNVSSIGMPKTESGRNAIFKTNPDIVVDVYQERLTATNAESIIQRYDVVLDGSDNFETRYIINKACVKKRIPFVMGSVLRFEGQVAVFDPSKNSPCYECLYPVPPPADVSPTCARAGVLGVIPGVVGTLEALEAMKLICGFGEPLVGKLLIFNGLTCTMRTLELRRDAGCKVCGRVNDK